MSIKLALFLTLILLAINPAEGAKISGKVYDYKIAPLNEVIIFVDTEPVQRFIVNDGTYYFELPAGSYTIIARTFNDSKNVLGTNEIVDIKDEGSYIFDLILAPVGPGDTTIITKEPGDEIKGVFNPYKYKDFLKDSNARWFLIAAAAIITCLIYVLFLMYKRIKHLKTKEKKEPVPISMPEGAAGEYVHSDTIEEDLGRKTTVIMEPLKVSSESIKNRADDKTVAINQDNATKTKEEITEGKHEDAYVPADDSAIAVLEIIKKEKRITQKDIRKQLPDSEAKISLVISEFEAQGIIKKIKKGRGNIIIYNG
jgi:uncharacterized membrane protein